jgi:hypothetical protein
MLAITKPQGVISEAESLAGATQEYGDVSEWQEWLAQEVVTTALPPLPFHQRKPAH